MSVHLPAGHLVGGAVFGFADLLGMQRTGYLSSLGAAGLGNIVSKITLRPGASQ
jgi:hypothetical protein